MPMNTPFLNVQTHKPFQMEAMKGKNWKPILAQSTSIIESLGYHWQLGSGTLLGMIREEDGLIPHDTDIDIDIIMHEKDGVNHELIMSYFRQHGFDLIRTQHYKGLPSQIAFVHVVTNIIVDLCFFYNFFGEDWYNVYEHGIFYRPRKHCENETLSKLGLHFNIPCDVEEYLDNRYGLQWREPLTEKECGRLTAGKYLLGL